MGRYIWHSCSTPCGPYGTGKGRCSATTIWWPWPISVTQWLLVARPRHDGQLCLRFTRAVCLLYNSWQSADLLAVYPRLVYLCISRTTSDNQLIYSPLRSALDDHFRHGSSWERCYECIYIVERTVYTPSLAEFNTMKYVFLKKWPNLTMIGKKWRGRYIGRRKKVFVWMSVERFYRREIQLF